jgi:PAS domain S-box-containing protein
MKIKTKLYISLYLSVCTMLVVMMALYWSYHEHNKADENERLLVEIQKAIFERTSLRDEYLQYREERAKIAWQKKTEYAEKVMGLVSERFKDDMSKAILNEMRRNYESTVAIFSKIVENRERKDLNEEEKALSREYENRLYSQILLKSHALSETTQRLLELSRRKSEKELKKANVFTFILVVALMIATLTNSALLNRLLKKRLETIRKGTKIIGDGNLDYRIDLRSKDEFEDVSNEFNAMSDKLKKSFVSIESLEKEITGRKQVEMALQESEGLYRTLIETSPDAIVLVDINTNFIMVNQMAVRLYGYQNPEEMIGKTFLNLIVPEERPRLFEHFKDTRQTGSNQILEHTSLKKDGSSFYAAVNASLIFDAQGKPKGIIAIIRDITEHKRAEEEREKLIHELQDALGKIQTLSGLLPICSWCKKIRDDEGYWNQIETYIGDHSEAEFTHSICPECMKKHYPDLADKKNKEVIKENIK